MALSKLTEEFLKYILEVKKPKDFVAIQEQELPESLKNQIFGLAEELAEGSYIKNVRKSGRPGNRGVDFYILPRGLSYFEENKGQEILPVQTTTFAGPVIFGSGNVTAGESINIKIPKEILKKSWFEKYWFPLILVIIPGIFVIIAAIIGKNPPTPTPVLTSTPIATLSITPTKEFLLSPTVTSTQYSTGTSETKECTISNGPITIGVIDLRPVNSSNPADQYSFEDILTTRLPAIGLFPEWVSPSATYYDLKKFDIIYLPSGWSIKNTLLENNEKSFKDFVKDGGGLLIEQPNSNLQFSPSFLPYPITYKTNEMDRGDWPLIIIDPSNSLITGLTNYQLPGPMDCADLSSSYIPLVRGSKTGCTSLAIASYEAGRIIISMGNASESVDEYYQISDEVLCRMFVWLAGK
jgi:hypothetical protein